MSSVEEGDFRSKSRRSRHKFPIVLEAMAEVCLVRQPLKYKTREMCCGKGTRIALTAFETRGWISSRRGLDDAEKNCWTSESSICGSPVECLTPLLCHDITNLNLTNEDLHTSNVLSSSCLQLSPKPSWSKIFSTSRAGYPLRLFPSSNASQCIMENPLRCEWSALANGAKAHSLAHGVAVWIPLST